MKAKEFKSNLGKQSIHIPRIIQTELIVEDEKIKSRNYISIDSNKDGANDLLESINRGLKDFEEGRTHSNESVRKLYEKYL